MSAGAVAGAVGKGLAAGMVGTAAPTWQYGRKALAVDVGHHAVSALATSLAYEWLDRHES